jgi:hypothetical protein
MWPLLLLTTGTFFYLGWWLEHEEDIGYGAAHTHPGATYYWAGAIPLVTIWILIVVARVAPRHAAARPEVVLLTLATAGLLVSIATPLHPGGLPLAAPLALLGTTALAIALPRPPWWGGRASCCRPPPSLLALFATIGVSFYLAWWLSHEEHFARESHLDHDHHRHNEPHGGFAAFQGEPHRASDEVFRAYLHDEYPFAEHYWKIAIPLLLVWFWATLATLAPVYLWHRPLVLAVASAAVGLLPATELPSRPDGVPAAVSLAVLAAALALMALTSPAALVVLRATNWRRRVAFPSTPEAFAAAVRAGALPVGSGWSFWLQYARARGRPVVSTRGLRGIREGARPQTVEVEAGVTFGELSAHLRARGLAMRDRVLFDGVTMGAALWTHAHGSSATTAFVDEVIGVEVVRRDGTRHASRTVAPALCAPTEAILSMTLRVVEDVPIVVSRVSLASDDPMPMQAWRAARYRMLLISRRACQLTTARGRAPEDEERVASAPRWENVLFFLGVARSEEYVQTLSQLQRSFGSLWPLEMLAMRVLRYRNTAVFIYADVDLPLLVARLRAFHRRHGGLTCVRQGRETLVLDVTFSAGGSDALERYWSLLYGCGVRAVALHPGKWVPKTVGPLRKLLPGR